jgi:hypothetical protein
MFLMPIIGWEKEGSFGALVMAMTSGRAWL